MMRQAGLGRIWAIIVPLALVGAGCKPANEYKPPPAVIIVDRKQRLPFVAV